MYSILPRRSAFVKRFFNLFEVFSALASAFRRSLRQLIYYIRASRVCQVLFSLRFEVSKRFPFGLPPFSDSSSSISELPEFVKQFFHFVEIFSLSRWHDRRVSDSLLTIPDLSFFVNTFFQGFSFSSNYLSPGACATLFFLFPHLPYARDRAQNASFFAPFMVHIGYLSYILLLLLRVSYL